MVRIPFILRNPETSQNGSKLKTNWMSMIGFIVAQSAINSSLDWPAWDLSVKMRTVSSTNKPIFSFLVFILRIISSWSQDLDIGLYLSCVVEGVSGVLSSSVSGHQTVEMWSWLDTPEMKGKLLVCWYWCVGQHSTSQVSSLQERL